MGIDEKRVRAKFIQLLRARTPDHPWVLKHDRAVRAASESIEERIDRVCCEGCPMGLSCATQFYCYLEARSLE